MINKIGDDFMLKYPKIRYAFDFPTLPITNCDIQHLYEIIKIIIKNESYLVSNNAQELLSTLDIYVSEETPIRQYNCDYRQILKIIEVFIEDYPGSDFRSILLDIAGIIRDYPEETLPEVLEELIEHLERHLKEFDNAEHIPPYMGYPKAKEIANALKTRQLTVPLLGIYNHERNRIVFYIYTIAEHFTKTPFGDDAEKIKTGLKIVLFHELFHAIHFYRMGNNFKDRMERWHYHAKHKNYRDSVIEGLARWFEYKWCCEYKTNDQVACDILHWHNQNIEKEISTFSYPSWPYAAAKAFIKHNTTNDFAATMVFTLSLKPDKYHWRRAYECLVDYAKRTTINNC